MATPPQGPGPKTQKSPGPQGHRAIRAWKYATGEPLFDVLAPIKRMRPGPGIPGDEQPIARPNEVVGRVHVIRGVRDDRTPSIQTPAPPWLASGVIEADVRNASPARQRGKNSLY